jgi:uncharacterized phiE125 gp8 family phage protein
VSWRIETVTPPETEPVTDQEALAQAKIESLAEEPNLPLYIAASRAALERWLNRGCLITQTLRLTASASADLKLLPVFPIQSIVTIETADGGDVTALFGAVAGDIYPAVPLTGEWPGPVTLTVTAGYGDDPDDVPADLRLAVLLGVSAMVDNKGALPSEFFDTLDHLLDGHRRIAIA